jgi:hypothetical protein
MAPELVADSRRVHVDSVKVDVYSFAVLMWAMWSRQRPYADMKAVNMFTMMNKIVDGRRPMLIVKQPQQGRGAEDNGHSIRARERRASLMRSQSTPEIGVDLGEYADDFDAETVVDAPTEDAGTKRDAALTEPTPKLHQLQAEDPPAATSSPVVEFPPLLGALIERCWAADPARRPGFSEIMGELQQSDLVAEVHAAHEPASLSTTDWLNARDSTTSTRRRRMPSRKIGRVRSKLRFALPLRRVKSTGMPGSLSSSRSAAAPTPFRQSEGGVFTIAEGSQSTDDEAEQASGNLPVRLDDLTRNLELRASPQ